jgi:succinate dehydrogenase/fumarate reductase flavoprotein subunit
VTTGSRVIVAAALLVAAGGCVRWSSPAARVATLERADRLAHEGAWEEAAAAYGEYLVRHPRGDSAARAAASRDSLRALLSARAEAGKLREELARLREELARRDGDLVRVRQEADRLKADLEKLKQVDLKLERRI